MLDLSPLTPPYIYLSYQIGVGDPACTASTHSSDLCLCYFMTGIFGENLITSMPNRPRNNLKVPDEKLFADPHFGGWVDATQFDQSGASSTK